jgi:hypothetical protein
VELAIENSDRREGSLKVHVNKISHVKTIDLVARELGEEVDWLHDVALEMDVEDGVIWVYGVNDEGVMAFTDFGIETLVELIRVHRDQAVLKDR